jgi:hypothetical protein
MIKEAKEGILRAGRIIKRFAKSKPEISIGWVGPNSQKTHPLAPQMTISAIAAIHEFGAEIEIDGFPATIPARPVVSWVYDTFRNQMIEELKAAIKRWYLGDSLVHAFGQMGVLGIERMRSRIQSRIPPPLHPKTLARRKKRGTGDLPLYDTRTLSNSLTWEVKE